MTVVDVLLLGLALSADAFSVTISNTCSYAGTKRSRRLLMPLFFGLFQALMPLGGYLLGGVAAQLIERFAGIVTLVILGFIGGNMIREGIHDLHAAETSCQCCVNQEITIPTLLMQAIATSIDAFAVGVGLRAQEVNLVFALAAIGVTTAICCGIGLVLGRRVGDVLGERAELVGGIVLVAIGVKAFLGL